jgi:hypothetical protein
MKKLNNFILTDYIEESVCDSIIEYFEKNPNNWKGSNHPSKQSIEMVLPFNHKYFEKLNVVLQKYKKIYPFCDQGHSPWSIWENVNIQKYLPKQGFLKYHWENKFPEWSFRHLVFMTYLNTVKVGGQTDFLYQKLKIKPKKGLTVIWPASWTHVHKGLETKELKYIVTGWYGYNKV